MSTRPSRVNRIPVMDLTPSVEGGRFPAKGVVGESFDVTALVFRDGHDLLGADVVLTDPDGILRGPVRMREVPGEVSRMSARVTPDVVGNWTFAVQSWSDPLATWIHDTLIKVPAGVDVELMFVEGTLLLERWEKTVTDADEDARNVVRDAVTALADQSRPVEVRLAVVESPELAAIVDEYPLRDLLQSSAEAPLEVARERALFSSWYEFFPRSEGAVIEGGSVVSGTLRTAAERLPAVAAMGFDVVYLPPIHPIGEINRKGR
ncbi:MAG: maltotransferase domain-containing protein, partial [Marmoricola sp.]